MSQHKTFNAQIDQLQGMIHWIRQELVNYGFDESTIRKVELASEEAIVNIIRHAYKGRKGDVDIVITMIPKSHVEIVISDQGPPFNPLAKKTNFDPSAPLEERTEGGLGILFMKQYIDEIHYERKMNKNILTFIKRKPH
ncbi:MAG: ATP-binding protein [Verrucomicrobia bacterium]|nr:ATP-binding protein [Verrucomicrobiota bacterium]